MKIDVVFAQNARGKGDIFPLQSAISGDAAAAASEHEHAGRALRLFQLHAAEQEAVIPPRDAVQAADGIPLKNLFGRADGGDLVAVHAHDLIGNFGGEVDLVQG